MGKIMKDGIQYGVGGNDIFYVDSDTISITANASSSDIGSVSIDEPTGAVPLCYTIFTEKVTGSWHVQLTYATALKSVAFYNYGTASNTWTGFVRAVYKR